MRALSRKDRTEAPALAGGSAVLLRRRAHEVSDPVLRVVLERVEARSTPRQRDDDHIVCLAVEGGGMRGAVSAGMCVVLEAAGVVDAFDRIYGVSAGALNAWATAVGQAALSATHYEDAVRRRVINPRRSLRGRPVIDFDLLFEELIGARKPLSFERLATGPEFRALATSLETLSLRVLTDFANGQEVLNAVRASASVPRLGGDAPLFRGERLTDGALIEPIPFETAVAEGATHVLVLRTRPVGYRKPAVVELGELLALRDNPRLQNLVRARQGIYNAQAAALERAVADGAVGGAQLLQIAVPNHARLIRRLESDARRVTDALRLGAAAMASTLLTESIELCWQPVVYRTTPRAAPPARAAQVRASGRS